MELLAKILTVSDSVAAGAAEDRGGPAVAEMLEASAFTVVDHQTTSDGVRAVAEAVATLADGFAGVIVTTGGTGFSPRDLTPEATMSVLERSAPGLAEAMRAVSPLGRLSRGAAGMIGEALIINVPGSPSGAVECLGAVVDVIPHALELLSGGSPHGHRRSGGGSAPGA